MPRRSDPPSIPNEVLTVEKALAVIVRARRLELGMSQEDVQGDQNLSQSYLSKIELGKREVGLVRFIQLARRLHMEPDQLLRQVLDLMQSSEGA